jgi:type I site-specific restriction-modification system R (restriction) subunit
LQNTAHKNPYKTVDEATQLDLVIVVNQLLTGYDSKWVNTLYLDKSLEYQNIIQAFSRTNRLNGPEKPFGTIRYYRKAHTMEQNIEEAIELYSGKQAKGLFVEKLYNNLEKLNDIFEEIKSVFNISGIENFSHLPEVPGEIKQFVNLYNQLIHCYESAMIQGFTWAKSTYEIQDYEPITVVITEYEFNILAQRYSEIEREPRDGNDSIAYDIDYQLPEGSRSRINYEYLNTNFKKYMNIKEERDSNLIQSLLNDLHRTFAQLPVELQPYAEMILNDVNNGELVIKEGWEFTDYLNEYQLSEEDDFIQDLVDSTNINEALLREMLDLRLTEVNINEYSRFDKLKSSVNVGHFSGYIEKNLGKMVIPIKVNMLIDRLLRAFLLEDVFDVTEYIKNYFNFRVHLHLIVHKKIHLFSLIIHQKGE